MNERRKKTFVDTCFVFVGHIVGVVVFVVVVVVVVFVVFVVVVDVVVVSNFPADVHFLWEKEAPSHQTRFGLNKKKVIFWHELVKSFFLIQLSQ